SMSLHDALPILAAGRSTFEFGRMGYAPKIFGKVHPKTKAPANALLFNMLIGIIALLTGRTGEIITIAVFGALGLYIIAMIAFFALRKKEPGLERPFKAPAYPAFRAIAVLALVAMIVYNPLLALLYFVMLLGSYGLFVLVYKPKKSVKQPVT